MNGIRMNHYDSILHGQNEQRVLVLDDEPDIRRTMVELFEVIGFTCDGAANGLEGIELLSTNDYWLILSDIMMPEMSGPEFFREIENRYRYDHFIFLTGYDVPESEENTIKKADLLISKPASLTDLLNSIDLVVRKKTA